MKTSYDVDEDKKVECVGCLAANSSCCLVWTATKVPLDVFTVHPIPASA